MDLERDYLKDEAYLEAEKLHTMRSFSPILSFKNIDEYFNGQELEKAISDYEWTQDYIL